MAENIVELLTDVADAIRVKKGTTDKINAQNFADEIKNLPSGGGDNGMGFELELYDATICGPDNIRVIRFNEGVKTIKTNLWTTCKKIKEVYIPNSVINIDAAPFNLKELEKIEVVEGSTYDSRDNCNAIIKKGSFYNKTILQVGCCNTVIPNGVEIIAYAAFDGASLLEEITLPSSVGQISSYGFSRCSLLTKVICLGDITKIGNYAFCNSTSLKLLDFSQCTSVPENQGGETFTNVPSDCKIVVPDDLWETWKDATNWSKHSSKIVKASDYTE